jgi:tetratricopeptide (TPR) repeat protein
MTIVEEKENFKKGMEAVDRGDTKVGLACLEGLFAAGHDPLLASYYAVCLAKERGELQKALLLCGEAMEDDRGNSLHYLNLGRVLVAAERKREAIKAFRDGLLYGKNKLIRKELDMLGWRKPPVISGLGREHPVNKYLGKILVMLRLR